MMYYLILLPEPRWLMFSMFFALFAIYFAAEVNLFHLFDGRLPLDEATLAVMALAFKLVNVAFILVATYYSFMLIRGANQAKEYLNAMLEKKKNDINNMLQNLNQGIFSLLSGGVIHEEYSKQLEAIFECKDIRGKHLKDIFDDRFSISAEQKTMIEHAVINAIDDHLMSFQFNEHIFPKKLAFRDKNRVKHLEFDWIPIVNDAAFVEKILVSVKDTTELIEAREITYKSQKEQRILEDIIASNVSEFDSNYQELHYHIQICFQILAGDKNYLPDAIVEIKRHLHTFKGASRFVRWRIISDFSHTAEDQIGKIDMQGGSYEDRQKTMRKIFQELDSLLLDYKAIYERRLRNIVRNQEGFQKFQAIISSLESLKSPLTKEQSYVAMNFIISSFVYKPLKSILENQLIELNSLARQLGKTTPKVEIIDAGISFHVRYVKLIKDVFTHCLRNSIDHGIESEDERLASGKPKQGTILIRVEKLSEEIKIRISDDGLGLNIKALKEMGIKLGLLQSNVDVRAVINLCFTQGVSTKYYRDNISGQGIGMDAVKTFLTAEGGRAEILPLAEVKDNVDYLPFELVISLPAHFGLESTGMQVLEEVLPQLQMKAAS